MLTFVVAGESRGSRLDRFVQRAFASQADPPSRAETQRWIAAGAVTVNGTTKRGSELLHTGDVVAVERPRSPSTTALAEDGVAFEIVYVDDAVVVVNKPAGLVVHPAKGHAGGTLVNGLLARGLFDRESDLFARTDGSHEGGHDRPGIVHRIDKGTSGLLVVARTAAARERLKEQLASHTMQREYDAIAVGDVTATLHATLYGRHATDRLRFTSRVRDGKRAVTHVDVVSRFDGATHVRCRLETGRTHQIRVHLAESGTPILGDTLYGRPSRDPEIASLARSLGHQALHARLLGFVHPVSGHSLVFEAGLPADFAAVLGSLRARVVTGVVRGGRGRSR
jgi:23S rRNA pseudouridine1911/1915/1917 synthase